MKIHHLIAVTLLLLNCVFLSACSNSKAIYFSETSDQKEAEFLATAQDLEPVIQPNDLLSISVSSLNPEASELFNISGSTVVRNASATNTISPVTGFLVDQDGYIQFPFLGKIKAAGLTKKEFQEGIRKEIVQRKLLVEPIVDIRYLNYKVSVLGEVARPSVLTIPNEKVTMLEALGMAGDLTLYANRENVLLIREEGGKKKLARIDLTSNELFTSPYYYLKSNDILYVEPNETKIQNVSATRQWLPIVLSTLSLLVISIDRLTR
ncbi:polysaccharide biosynthesis/export family protein [Botryobacter ruber]|uniref:polysaccharide biosynthesis/export family protein n=1 Tax=Botryobacter ruber TaxID=2171629 RepID=UPI000E0B92DA|nr:polysaccharide biosynthesis/export family protein [Botryobacter ruber]